jgi:hypothetical protein
MSGYPPPPAPPASSDPGVEIREGGTGFTLGTIVGVIAGLVVVVAVASTWPMEYQTPATRAPMVSDIAPRPAPLLASSSTAPDPLQHKFIGSSDARDFLVRLPAEAYLVSVWVEEGPFTLRISDLTGSLDWIELFRAEAPYSASTVFAPLRPGLFRVSFNGRGKWRVELDHASTVAFPIVGN